jgi:hypothetical protein
MRLAHSFTFLWTALIDIVDVGGVVELSAVGFTRTPIAALGEFEMPRAQRFDSGGEAR